MVVICCNHPTARMRYAKLLINVKKYNWFGTEIRSIENHTLAIFVDDIYMERASANI